MQEEFAMSEHHEKASLIDRFWPLAVIGVGLAFVLTVALFHPYH